VIRDRLANLFVAFAFSVSLGVAIVAIPLVALEAGYDPATIGFLAATSAASQLAFRLVLPWLFARFTDRSLIAVAALAMLAAFVLLLVSTAIVAFVVAQLLQGAARAVFWTSSQTHAVRGGGRAVDRLVDLNIAGNIGTLIGPVTAGLLAGFGLEVAIAAAAVGAAIAALATALLLRLPTYDRRRSAGTMRLLRRDGVDVACWASAAGGAWWAMLGSFIPVILSTAGVEAAGIGWLVTLSEGASIIGILVLRRLPNRQVRRATIVGSYGVGLSLVGLAFVSGQVAADAVLLVTGGMAGGTVTTLAPALASLAASTDEQGDVLALTGTFRAAALLAAPAAVGAALAVTALSEALALLGVGLAVPGVALSRRSPAGPPGARAAGPAHP